MKYIIVNDIVIDIVKQKHAPKLYERASMMGISNPLPFSELPNTLLKSIGAMAMN